MRKGFNVPAGKASSSRPLILRINYNDGFIAWVNGVEVARANAGAEKAYLYFDQVAYRGSTVGAATSSFNLGNSSSLLLPGENTLAIQVANQNPAGNLRLEMSPGYRRIQCAGHRPGAARVNSPLLPGTDGTQLGYP